MSSPEPLVNLTVLIDRLVPMADPDPVMMLPQTVGWWVVAFGLLVLGLRACWKFFAHHRANAYRKAALDELDAAGANAATVALILRRTALYAFPREDVAGLHGEEWIEFLSQTAEGIQLSETASSALIHGPFELNPRRNAELAQMARQWVETHQRPAC